MTSIIPEPLPTRPEETSGSLDLEFLECRIGGCRFGIPTAHVHHTDVWRYDDLDPIPGTPIGVVGQTRWGGRWIPVIDLRQLFCLNTALDQSDAQMFLVVEAHDDRFILLLDGLMSIQRVPLTTFKTFTSLYVSDIRWLSGALIFDVAVVPMLDVEALNAHCQADGDRHAGVGAVPITAHSLQGEL